MHLTQFKFLIVSLLGFSIVVGIFNITNTLASINDPETDYVNLQNIPAISMEANETREMTVLIKNTSVDTWGSDVIKLGTIFHTGDKNRPSIWATDAWESNTRILVSNEKNIKPLQVAEFTFSVTAPSRAGIYQEYFRPLIEYSHWLKGEPIVITFSVGNNDGIVLAEGEAKEIRIYRDTQQADMLAGGIVVATLPVSTGKAGYTTPAGRWRIMNHFEEAYSQAYELYMGNWMAIVQEGKAYDGYGMHSLAYWKTRTPLYPDGTIKDGRLYTGNRVYEDVEHLGTPMSHGCIRFGIEEVKVLYNWAENDTLVTIV